MPLEPLTSVRPSFAASAAPLLAEGSQTLVVGVLVVAVVGLAIAMWRQGRIRRRYEALLVASSQREQFLSTIITSEPSCVKTVSRDLKLLSMNPAGLHAIEADSFEQVDGADLRDVVHPDHLDDFIALNDRVFAGDSVSLRFRIIGLRGTVRWMETHAAPMRGAAGDVLYHLAVTNDVSDRVCMEERLVEARDAAVAGTRAKSRFLANMSHEIRTPMTSILGWCEVLQDEHASDPRTTETLAVVERNGRHLLSILDEVLDLSRIEAGKVAVNHDVFDPAQLVSHVRESLLPRVWRGAVSLEIGAGGELPKAICSDRKLVEQVLVNLANNALKFTEEGAVTLSASAEVAGGREMLVFEVRDTGPGIAAEQLDRIFDAFEQADATESRQHGGVGLGLSISRGIAGLLGGSLSLESTPGEGTTARLAVPVGVVRAQPAPGSPGALAVEPMSARRRARDVALQGRRVLLVEDGLDNQRLITFLLKRAGCEVEVAQNGSEAVTRTADATFDIIVMDLQMPELDGLSATRAIRAREDRTPIVALTADAMRGDRERALDAGCDGYLTKPVRRDELLATLQQCLPDS